jgi:hypothetical protein
MTVIGAVDGFHRRLAIPRSTQAAPDNGDFIDRVDTPYRQLALSRARAGAVPYR